jgi:hypothetical protein
VLFRLFLQLEKFPRTKISFVECNRQNLLAGTCQICWIVIYCIRNKLNLDELQKWNWLSPTCSLHLWSVPTLKACSTLYSSVADPDPGSGAFLTPRPGSGIGFFRVPDLGSRIRNPYFWELSDTFLGKKFYNFLKTGQQIFLQHFKNKIIFYFVKFVATKKGWQQIFFSPLSFLAVFGSEIRDLGCGMGKNHDPGSRIRNTVLQG